MGLLMREKGAEAESGVAVLDVPTTFCLEAWTEQTGGGCMVDVVLLRNGNVLTVTDDVVMVWRDYADYAEQNADDLGFVHFDAVTQEG